MHGLSLSEELRRRSLNVWSRLLEHPFVDELYRGVLPIEKFKFYAVQDYNYLMGLIRSLAIAASKGDHEAARTSLSHASFLATTEMENYRRLLVRLGIRIEDVIEAEPAPTNLAYVNFMIATCYTGSTLECLVSLLPCYWSYRDIALHNREKLEGNRNEIYREWASVYLSREYGEAVDEFRAEVDRLWRRYGGDLERLSQIFHTAARYEYLFWEMAYNMEEWIV
ncbi:MAG: thiaminase II [Desulfurococcales archaeon]|nr:thiaminase II [Desulfurococcales archaeon]